MRKISSLFSQKGKLFFPFFPVVIYKRDFFEKTIRIEQMKNFLWKYEYKGFPPWRTFWYSNFRLRNFCFRVDIKMSCFFGKFHNSSFTINIDCPPLSNTLKNTLFKCDSNDAIRTEKALFLIKLQQFEDLGMIFLDLGKNRIKFECISVFFMKKKMK